MFPVQRIFFTLCLCALCLVRAAGAEPVVRPAGQESEVDVEKRLKVLKRQAGDRRAERRVAAYDELLEFGEPGCEIIRAAASRRLEREWEVFEKAQKRSGEIGKRGRLLREELDRRRQEARAVIFDRSIYPDEDHGRVGQPKVDEVVRRVDEIWETPVAWLYDEFEEVAAIFDALDDSVQWIQIAGGEPPEEAADPAALFDRAAAVFDVESWVPESTLEWNQAVREYNRTGLFTLDDQERTVVEMTNAYRWKLGLRILESDERLHRGARSHSREMAELEYFSHTSPTAERRSPSQRVRLHGYPGGVSENISSNSSGAGAFRAWYNSSGHHRNMLGGASQIGVGRGGEHPGRLFTQNFGSAPSMRGRKVTDPILLYLGKVRELNVEDVDEQVKLAAWCLGQELLEECRRHVEAALTIAPEHRKARTLEDKLEKARQKVEDRTGSPRPTRPRP